MVSADNVRIARKLVNWIAGAPPGPDARTEDRLRWTRRLYRINLGAIVVVVVAALVDGGTFLWILAGVGAVMWVGGIASISMRIHQERSRAR